MNLRQPETGKSAGQKLDLGQPDSTPQFRKLRSVHEIFAKSLSNVLSTFLQAEIQANLAAMNVTTAGNSRRILRIPVV